MRQPRWIVAFVITFAALAFLAVPHCAEAARVGIEPGVVRRDGGAVVTATLHNVVTAREKHADDRPIYEGFRFDVHVEEVLWGVEIAAGDDVHINFSAAGYGSV